jgi:acyl carrier protein
MNDPLWTALTDVFRDTFDDDEITITPSTTAKDVYGWDSLTHIRLMLSTERAFGIKLSAPEVGRLKSVGDLFELIKHKKSQ